MKPCTKCGVRKSFEEFYVLTRNADGRTSWCRTCFIEAATEKNWVKKYGITREQYNELFEKQKGCCAICGRHQSAFERKLAVDYNHITGANRGLLCHLCNTGLGQFREDLDIILAAYDYILYWEGGE